MLTQDFENLLTRYFAGEANAQERAQIEAWRNAASENQTDFVAHEKIWRNAVAPNPPHVPNVDQAWAELEAKLDLPKAESHARILEMKPPRATVTPAWLFTWHGRRAWAAAAILTLVFGSLLYKSWQRAPHMQSFTTANAEQRKLDLPDGTKVTLNSASTLQFAQDFAREVTLTGEAFFEVAHDRAQPFLVHTANAQIKVLGTQFNVWSRQEETRVIVREGRVAFGGKEKQQGAVVELAAHQMSVLRGRAAPEPSRDVDAEYTLGWLEGRIVFEQAALTEVITELEHVYDVKIVLADSKLQANTITGSFHRKPVEAVLASICLTLNLQYRQEGGNYIIYE